MSDAKTQEVVSLANSSFWNDLCGSLAAQALGVIDDKQPSLKKFDDWYFSFYPYLFLHIPFEDMKEKDVMEVGLGYGTVSQRIAESGARYRGLDIAEGPVGMVNHRLQQAGLPGSARVGSILQAPFADESFDFVVAIGCLHHTGSIQRAIDECRRVLRPGGQLIFMVYYAFSYRRLMQARTATIKHWVKERLGYRGVVQDALGAEKRGSYDKNASGEAAPHTDWISMRSLRNMCRSFSSFSASIENVDAGERPFDKWGVSRRDLMKRWYPRYFGLDLYATATK